MPTEYKVLQSQTEGCFLKCMKMFYNGKIQFYYLTRNNKTFASMIPNLKPESFMSIVSNMLKNILEVKNNGFLACRNIDISFEHVYVDLNTLQVALLYLPASIHFYQDDSCFENEFRTSLVKLLSSVSTLESQKTIQFLVDLSNGMIGFEGLARSAQSGVTPNYNPIGETKSCGKQMQMIALNAPMQLVIDITKEDFILGKKVGQVDCVLDFNSMISRMHCKVVRRGNEYFITDLQSVNGTYINRVRLQPNRLYPIKNGDVIRLANSDFQAVIR